MSNQLVSTLSSAMVDPSFSLRRCELITKCITAARLAKSAITEPDIANVIDFAMAKIAEGFKNEYFKSNELNRRSIVRSVDILEEGRFIIHLNRTKTNFTIEKDPETWSVTRSAHSLDGAPDNLLGCGYFKVAKFSIDSDGNLLARCTAKDTLQLEKEICVTRKLSKIFGDRIVKLLYENRFQSKSGEPKTELIFRLCKDGSLDRCVSDITIKKRLEIARAVLSFLRIAHEHGYTHGDLYVRNIFLDPDVGVVVADFGNSVDSSSEYYESARQNDIGQLADFLIELFRDTRYEQDIRDEVNHMAEERGSIELYVNSLQFVFNQIEQE